MKKKLVVVSSFVLGLAPAMALAQTGGAPTACSTSVSTIGDILCRFSGILNAVLPVLIALGVVYFVWGVITYVVGSDEEAKKAGRDRIIFGIIGLAVIIGLWGLVHILTNTFTLTNTSQITLPTVPY